MPTFLHVGCGPKHKDQTTRGFNTPDWTELRLDIDPGVNRKVSLPLNGNITLTRADEVITFVNRNLEPYWGYHIFMRSLPEILKRRPKARVLIVGADDVSYGARPPEGKKWKDIFAEEVRPQISDADWSRVHFLGSWSSGCLVQSWSLPLQTLQSSFSERQ